MEIVVSPYILWNVVMTVVILPIGFLVRNVLSEQKRIDILINKTREEIARDYATREQIEADFQRIMDSISNIDTKIDRLQSKTYFQD
jgi:uncharacterized membrane protein|tara:strand:+ start:5062 stop:5322 length:261 start_codon:yes stop_codon:yes gene_type:complete